MAVGDGSSSPHARQVIGLPNLGSRRARGSGRDESSWITTIDIGDLERRWNATTSRHFEKVTQNGSTYVFLCHGCRPRQPAEDAWANISNS